MGLDGFSVNNLMLNKGNTSKENAILADALANSRGTFSRSVDQLEGKQEIDADDRENPSFSGGSTQGEAEEGEVEEQGEDSFQDGFEGLKLPDGPVSRDLPKAQNTLEKINPKDLSKLVIDLKNASGIFVDKKI